MSAVSVASSVVTVYDAKEEAEEEQEDVKEEEEGDGGGKEFQAGDDNYSYKLLEQVWFLDDVHGSSPTVRMGMVSKLETTMAWDSVPKFTIVCILERELGYIALRLPRSHICPC